MKYVIYCRKSTDTEDKQVASLESQENELLELAKRYGLNVVKILHESRSAKAEGRPIFASVLAMIQKGEADAILCWKLDRLARNMADAGRIIDLLQHSVIKEIRTHDAIHLPSDNVLMIAVQLGMANQYVRDLSENVKRGNRTKLERGGWPNHAPFGYINNKFTKTLYLDEKVAPFIPRLFEVYAQGGKSLKEVSEQLYAEGLRTRSGKKANKGFIHRVIRDPFYTGVMLRTGKYYQGTHEPLISKELYDTANNVLDGKLHGRQQKRFFHLRGFMKCANCGCAITASKRKGHDYYFCTNGKRNCEENRHYLRAEKIDEMIAEALTKLQCDKELVEIAYEAAKEKVSSEGQYSTASVEMLEKRVEAIESSQSKLADSYAAEVTPEAIYTPKMKAWSNEIVALKTEIKKLKGKSNEGVSTLEPIKNTFLQGISAQKNYLDASPEEKRVLVSELLWNLSLGNQKIQSLQFKPLYAAIAKEPKPDDFAKMLRGQDSDLLRKLMGLAGKPFPTLPRENLTTRSLYQLLRDSAKKSAPHPSRGSRADGGWSAGGNLCAERVGANIITNGRSPYQKDRTPRLRP
ncbi:MAG: recombinase family protein [Candidatus Pacebacteria bacterium]|nr:recombinase family protein [Candidatus Paceibacterota bacterium]